MPVERKKSFNENGTVPVVNKKDNYISRIRRTQSVAKAEDIVQDERKTRSNQPDRPCHKARDSLFSWSSGFYRFEGFVNWGALLLIIGSIRLFLENALKYGLRVKPRSISFAFYTDENVLDFQSLYFIIGSLLHILFVFVLEKWISRKNLHEKKLYLIQVFHLIFMLFAPSLVFHIYGGHHFSLVGRVIICSHYLTMTMKLWSYIQVNSWCRVDRKTSKSWEHRRRTKSFRELVTSHYEVEESDEEPDPPALSNEINFSYAPISYPQNLTLSDLSYFMVAPTLSYELNFPRSMRIRKRFVFRRFCEMFALVNVFLGLFQQWIVPSVQNSFKPFAEMNYMKCCERILKLAIPNHLLWLIMFYMFFHSFLNLMAEILRFADRNFYQDWWNSKDLGVFWRKWNMPVHKFCVRHIFLPLQAMKCSKFSASVSVFLVSAVFHEYAVSIPLRMYKIQVFLGMMMQLPLIHLSMLAGKYLGYRAGNATMWAALIIGQPAAVMIYYHDYIIQNYT